MLPILLPPVRTSFLLLCPVLRNRPRLLHRTLPGWLQAHPVRLAGDRLSRLGATVNPAPSGVESISVFLPFVCPVHLLPTAFAPGLLPPACAVPLPLSAIQFLFPNPFFLFQFVFHAISSNLKTLLPPERTAVLLLCPVLRNRPCPLRRTLPGWLQAHPVRPAGDRLSRLGATVDPAPSSVEAISVFLPFVCPVHFLPTAFAPGLLPPACAVLPPLLPFAVWLRPFSSCVAFFSGAVSPVSLPRFGGVAPIFSAIQFFSSSFHSFSIRVSRLFRHVAKPSSARANSPPAT